MVRKWFPLNLPIYTYLQPRPCVCVHGQERVCVLWRSSRANQWGGQHSRPSWHPQGKEGLCPACHYLQTWKRRWRNHGTIFQKRTYSRQGASRDSFGRKQLFISICLGIPSWEEGQRGDKATISTHSKTRWGGDAIHPQLSWPGTKLGHNLFGWEWRSFSGKQYTSFKLV